MPKCEFLVILMNALNYIVFGVYLAAVLFIGYLCSSKNRTAPEFFLASRSMRWFPVGISLMVTMFSAANFKAFSTEIAGHGLYVMVSIPVFALSGFVVTRFLLPRFYNLKLVSLYAILEQRFDVRVRRLAGGMFVLWRVVWMAVTLFASGIILSAVTGISWVPLVWVVGGVSLVYTLYGGIRAVIWTDVLQFCVIICGIIAGVVVAVMNSGDGIAGLFGRAYANGTLAPFAPFDSSFFSFDPRVRITLWSGLFGTLVAFVARYGADQVVAQRYFTARSLKDANMGVWCNVVAATVMLLLLSFFGIALGALASDAPAGIGDLLSFAINNMPAGISGLLCAGILAASMSSIDSGINACSAVYMDDFHPWFSSLLQRSWRGGAPSMFAGRVCVYSSAVFGLVSIGAAFAVSGAGDFFGMINKVVNGLGAPLLALVLLALFSKRANAAGCFIGGAIGMIASVLISVFVQSLALHYYAVVNLVITLAACLVLSVLFPLKVLKSG